MSTGDGGATARVGQLYPLGGICDHEIQLMASGILRFHTTRLPFRRTRLEDGVALADDVEQHAQLLADAQVDLIAFNCTAASMLIGAERIRQRIQKATGTPCVTTIDAVLAGLRFLGAHRVGLLTPYPSEVEDREVSYLAASGIEVTDRGGPACDNPIEQGTVTPAQWEREATRLDLTGADAVLLSCAGSQFAAAIDPIERLTSLPVLASNQALLWHVLRTLEISSSIAGYGRLLK